MKYLFIDDDRMLLRSFARAFSGHPNVAFAECHSVEDALRSIAENSPDVIFLDHHLTEGGDEGLRIADSVSGVKIYTTTSNTSVLAEYQKRGIERVGKTDLKMYRSIIS